MIILLPLLLTLEFLFFVLEDVVAVEAFVINVESLDYVYLYTVSAFVPVDYFVGTYLRVVEFVVMYPAASNFASYKFFAQFFMISVGSADPATAFADV